MREFKVGDRVICIDDNVSFLKLGQVYTITEIFTHDKTILVNKMSIKYWSKRFKLATSEIIKKRLNIK